MAAGVLAAAVSCALTTCVFALLIGASAEAAFLGYLLGGWAGGLGVSALGVRAAIGAR